MSKNRSPKILPLVLFVLGCMMLCQPTYAQNQSVGSGDWFDDANWLDNFGNNDHPTSGDNHEVHLSGGNFMQIFAGNASTGGDLHVGDIGGGTAGSGELQVLGSGSLDVDGFLHVGGAAGTQNRLLIDTTGQVNGILRVGQNSATEAILDLQNGTLGGSLQLGLLGRGRMNLVGGQFVGGNFNNPLSISRGGLLNQTGGTLTVANGVTEVESTGQYLLSGGTAEINELRLNGGIVDVASDAPGGANLIVDGIFENKSFLAVGLGIEDAGTLRIGEGGSVVLDAGFIADDQSARAIMTGGSLAAIGNTADLIVDDGQFNGSSGTVTADSDFLIQGGSNNQATIAEFSGDLQVDIADTIAVGLSQNGNARLDIREDASVNSGSLQFGNVGNQAEFNMTGGDLTSNTLLAGNGALDTRVNLSGGNVTLGGAAVFGRTSDATVTLSGVADFFSTAQFELGQEIGVTGTLNVNETASLETAQFIVGREGTGIANLEGESSIDATSVFAGVSERGNGTIRLSDEARLSGTQSLVLASAENSTGNVRVSDDAVMNFSGSLFMATNDVDSSARLDVLDNAQVTIAGNSFAGNFQGDAVVNIESLGGNALLEVEGDASFGGSSSNTLLSIDGGEIRANNILFDGFRPDTTNNRLEFNAGKILTRNNLEFQRGVEAGLFNGTVEVGGDLVVGNESTSQTESVVVDQVSSDVFVEGNFEFVADGESTYQIQDGELNVLGDANLGTGLSDNAGFGVLRQDGGRFRVSGDLVNVGLEHVHSEGELEVRGDLRIGDDDDFTFASFSLEEGVVDVGRSVRVLNDELSISGGTFNAANAIAVGSLSNSESFAALSIDGGSVQTTDLTLDSVGSSGVSVDLKGGALVVDRILINADEEADAAFTQFGGELHVNEILTNGEFATFGMLGGSLETISDSLTVDGDLAIAGEAELRFKRGEIFEVSGSFFSFDAGLFGDQLVSAGAFDLTNVEEIVGEDGFLPLITVGDNSNLLGGAALDSIHLIEGFNATRLTESEFLAEFNGGNFNGRAFALAEGTTFGHGGSVGIAFANFSAVPEPGAGLMLLVMFVATASRRRRA